MKEIERDIPNWKRFRQMYPEESAFADQFESRYAKMASGEAKERLAKLVNVELGIAVLRETEIDRESFSKMLAAIAK